VNIFGKVFDYCTIIKTINLLHKNKVFYVKDVSKTTR